MPEEPCWLDALIEFGICSRYTNVCSCRDAYRCVVNLLAEISIIENLFYVKLLSGKCETRMVLGFRRQSNKDTKVQSSHVSHQMGRQRRNDHLPPPMRSPVLESLDRGKTRRTGTKGANASRSRRSATPGSRVSYATGEAVVARPVQPRKRLPRSSKRSVNVVRQQRSGITAGWRLQGLWEPDQQDASAQAISEEEQKKLAELELDMRLPRVAGKIDSWLLIIVLIFGHTVYGASRWLTFGSFFSIQPSEVAKLILALYIADWLARKGNQVSTFLYGLAPFVILVGVVLGLVLLENDMGTAIVIAGFATAMFFTAGANIVQFLLAMACGGLIFIVEAFSKGYRYLRLIGFLDPFKHVSDLNLQLYQSLLALGSGGWFGLGLGASRQKTGYLPLPFTDSILAILGEELGFIGCTLVVMLFLFLAFRGFRLARRTQDIYGALLATGITTWLVLQAMINVGATTASIPYTGVPLPFISYGGSSLVISLAAVGVLLNISRYIQEPESPALARPSATVNLRKKI